jgi:hypothetical protein
MSGQRTLCSNNMRQLILSWHMYNGDFTGHIVTSCTGNCGNWGNPAAWAPGYCGGADQPGSFADVPGGIGLSLTGVAPPFNESSAQALQAGAFWPYASSLPVYQCPGDHTTVTNVHRFRNYAMNCYMNGYPTEYKDGAIAGYGDGDPPVLVFFQKEAQVLKPAGLFVFIEQDPFSIDDDEFDLNPYDGAGFLTGMEAPSRVHANCFNWSFADGHSETYNMRDYAKSINWVAPAPAGSFTVQQVDGGGILNPDWQAVTNRTSIAAPTKAAAARP